jgi:hypothetical protein
MQNTEYDAGELGIVEEVQVKASSSPVESIVMRVFHVLTKD